jgi:hypothetical protein
MEQTVEGSILYAETAAGCAMSSWARVLRCGCSGGYASGRGGVGRVGGGGGVGRSGMVKGGVGVGLMRRGAVVRGRGGDVRVV